MILDLHINTTLRFSSRSKLLGSSNVYVYNVTCNNCNNISKLIAKEKNPDLSNLECGYCHNK